jgi:ATP adenylyltransferase
MSAVRHEQLWAPWRLGYIKGETSASEGEKKPLAFLPGADPGCFVCRGVADRSDRENLIVRRGPRTLVILNRYPYNNGHLLVAPLAHKGRLDELDDQEHLECQQSMTALVGLLERLIHAEGFNIGLNLGRVAGAGLPGHLHWHIVPRWHGDTNYMSSVAGMRVIPQSLDALWELLDENLRGPGAQL